MWENLRRALSPAKADPRSGVATWHLAPGFGYCFRCRTNWKFVEGHSTKYGSGKGCFPLCELCWSDLTPEERLPFYYVLFRQWEWDAGRGGYDLETAWPEIERAVLDETSDSDTRPKDGDAGSTRE